MHKEGTVVPNWTAAACMLPCCVVKPGRTFLRRMISLATSVRELHFKVRLNRSFRSDLGWWASFLPAWNGVGMMSGVVPMCPAGTITSDASGSWAFTSAGDEATRVMGRHPHHYKGASTDCDWGGPLGRTVARTNCTLLV